VAVDLFGLCQFVPFYHYPRWFQEGEDFAVVLHITSLLLLLGGPMFFVLSGVLLMVSVVVVESWSKAVAEYLYKSHGLDY
jgi:hypothetical protein